MKPHIKRLGGLWYCAGAARMGCGFKAWDAYVDWFLTIKHDSLEQINEILGQGL